MGCTEKMENEVESSEDEEKWTWAEWKCPTIAIVLTFLCNVESSMMSVGEWSYMETIDDEATPAFYGTATSVSMAGHAIFAFIFSMWAYKISSIKTPMLVGRCITLISCVMYIFVEFVPVNRRWMLLACYLLFGIGFGTSPLLRSYIARVTSEDNRSTAYALQNGASVLSVIVAPVAQLCFSGLPHPGRLAPPHISFNIFTAPIWFSVATNIIAIILTVVALEDRKEQPGDGEASTSSSSIFSLTVIRGKIAQIRSLNLPWALIAVVIFVKAASDLDSASASAVGGPVLTVMYAFTGERIVLTNAISQIVIGILALALCLIFFMCRLGRFVSCRVLFLFSNIVIIIGYIITYPYPFSSNPMQPFNETTRTGCDPLEYTWCERQLAVSIYPFLIILIVTSAFAAPAISLSIDTMYSKMIGDIDQNMMQSVLVIVEDITQIVGPIYGTSIFTLIGLNYISIINGSIYIVGTIVWLAAWRWLEPYK